MTRDRNAAIYYDPDGYDTSRKKLMGRHAAGEGFLLGFAQHADVSPFYCYSDSRNYLRGFTDMVRSRRPDAEVSWVQRGRLNMLEQPGCLFVPGPGVGQFAWRRRAVDERSYSICGVTHTTATHAIMDIFGDLVMDPVQEWDAVVCTSSVVRETAEKVTGAYIDHLSSYLGAKNFSLPQFPVIPLGVDCDTYKRDKDWRGKWRQRLGIAEDDIAVMYLGRLSFYEKAHPLPMYRALELAAQKTNRRLHLIQAGWFPNEGIQESYLAGAEALCPSVNSIILDGRKPEVRYEIWSAADIFTSLSDNIQETFGLTPIEAMAVGLPLVVSDWNGYKDTVRDGVDGFRVPTMMPPQDMGRDLADRYADNFDHYGRYCGYASQMIAVDTARCAEAYGRLVEDPDLRHRMGEAGRKRAREVYDWRVVVGQYQDLWESLAERRRAAAKRPAGPRPKHVQDPGRKDPFWIFDNYPTSVLSLEDRIALAPGASLDEYVKRRKLKMISFAKDVLPEHEDCQAVLQRLADSGPCRARELVEMVPTARRRRLFRGLVWLFKLDLVQIEPAGRTG